jgi:hypothetical protein
MKYVLLFMETEEFEKRMAEMSEEELQAEFERVGKWFAEHDAKILHHVKLQSPATATTLRRTGGVPEGDPIVTDGPFVEGKEVVSGIAEVEVADLDEAMAMARSWPACPVVEIRPAT